jgi:hypothetical protein
MMTSTWFAILVISASACASTPQRAPRNAQAEPRPQPRASVDPARLHDLADAVHALATASGNPAHRRIVTALEALAGVIEQLPTRPAGTAMQIRQAATQLASSAPTSLDHADLVQRALREAERALQGQQPASARRPAFLLAMAAVGGALQELDGTRPLLEQQPSIIAALEAATGATFLAHDEDPPFPLPDVDAGTSRPPAAALNDARTDTLALARAGWPDAHTFAAKLMTDLGNVLAASSCTGTDVGVAKLRFEAERLDRARQGGFDEPGSIKAALTAALDVLEQGAPDATSVRDARDAVASINEHASLPFQRAPIQDAARATLGAFVQLQPSACFAP